MARADLKWFKIWQDGYDSTTHQWGSDVLFLNGGNATFTIPACLASGNYLLRAEAIGKCSMIPVSERPSNKYSINIQPFNLRQAILVPSSMWVDFFDSSIAVIITDCDTYYLTSVL